MVLKNGLTLARLKFVERIPDPIWGQIAITSLERKLLRTPPLRRLHHIRQMGLAYLAFPGANHTRYEHSLGTMHVAYRLLELMDPSKISWNKTLELARLLQDPKAVQTLRVAALLHDIGHPPFSHVVEEALRKKPELLDGSSTALAYYRHEDYTRDLILNDESIQEALKGFEIETVANLAVGRAKGNYAVLNPLVDGDVDADRIDYVLRDCYHCGIQLRFYLDDLREKLSLVEEGQRDLPGYVSSLYFYPEAAPVLATILHARFRLIRSVHLHPTNRIATQMLIELLQESLSALEDRKQVLVRLHSTATTTECENTMGQGKTGSGARSIIVGSGLYEEVATLDFESLSPYERLNLYLILQRINFVPELQEMVRTRLQQKKLIVDIREAAPPKFRLLGPGPVNLYDRNYVLHGLLVDSFRDLKVHVYGPEDSASSDSIKNVLRDCIPKVAGKVRAELLREKKVVDLEFILAAMRIVENQAKGLFDGLDSAGRQSSAFAAPPVVWAYGQLHLQRAILRTQDLLKTVPPGMTVEKEYIPDYSQSSTPQCSKLGRDLERLTVYGLLYRVDQVVSVPKGAADNGAVEWNYRVDRRLSGYARVYLQRVELKPVLDLVGSAVEIQQNGTILDLQKKLFELELRRQAAAHNKDIRRELGNDMADMRREIAENNGFVVTIG